MLRNQQNLVKVWTIRFLFKWENNEIHTIKVWLVQGKK